VTDVAPGNVSVTVHAGAFGAGTVSLAHAEGDTWRGRFTVDASDVPADGGRAVEVLATNRYHNTATATSSTLVVDTAPPDADVGPDVTVAAGTKTTFDADATTDLTEVVRYHWSFADGASATGLTATHVYEAPGEYTVTLTATDTAGNSATATRVVTVTEVTRATATPRPTRTPLATPTPRPTRTPRPTPVPEESTPLPRPTRDADTTVNTTVGDERVDMSVSGVDAGAVLSLSVPAGARSDAPGSLRRVVLSPTRGGAFTLAVRTDPASTAHGPALAERRAVDTVRYWRVNHSISDTAVASASFAFTVPRERLDGASPDAVTLYRLHDGRWQGYDAQRVRAAGGRLHYRATVPGLSTFAVGIKQTDVAVVDTSLRTERLRAGETVTVRATAENAGNASATRTLALRGGGGTLAERTVTLPPGERRSVTFAVTPASAGTLDLSVAGTDAGTLTVAPADTATTTDADSDGFGALAALVAVVATAAVAALCRSALSG
jgi:PKD repeat protein